MLISPAAIARKYDDVISSGYITIGVYNNFPPFSALIDGEPSGLDIDVAKIIADEMGLELKLHWTNSDETLDDDLRNNVWKGHYLDKNDDQPLAPKKLADVMLRIPYDHDYANRQDPQTGETINEHVVMFGPYQKETWSLAYDYGQLQKDVSSVAVFRFNSIGVEIDSLPAFYLTTVFGGTVRPHVNHFKSASEAFEAMQQDKLTAVMAMTSEIDSLMSKQNDADIKKSDIAFPKLSKRKWEVGMAVKSDYRQLGYAIADIIEEAVRSGKIADISATHGIKYQKPDYYDFE